MHRHRLIVADIRQQFVQQLASRIFADRPISSENIFASWLAVAQFTHDLDNSAGQRHAMVAPERLRAVFRYSPNRGLNIELIEPRQTHGGVAQGREDDRFEQPRVSAGRGRSSSINAGTLANGSAG